MSISHLGCHARGKHKSGKDVVFLTLIVHSTAKSGLSGSSEKLGGPFLDFVMVER